MNYEMLELLLNIKFINVAEVAVLLYIFYTSPCSVIFYVLVAVCMFYLVTLF